jgi:hypothetical protein
MPLNPKRSNATSQAMSDGWRACGSSAGGCMCAGRAVGGACAANRSVTAVVVRCTSSWLSEHRWTNFLLLGTQTKRMHATRNRDGLSAHQGPLLLHPRSPQPNITGQSAQCFSTNSANTRSHLLATLNKSLLESLVAVALAHEQTAVLDQWEGGRIDQSNGRTSSASATRRSSCSDDRADMSSCACFNLKHNSHVCVCV